MTQLRRHKTWVALAASCCAVVLAACGSSGKSSGRKVAAARSQGIRFANCMRDHGVPNFPDPGGGGGVGINLDGTGIDPQSPAFRSASQACRHLTPGGIPGGVKATEGQFVAAVRFAKCLRTHGYPDFPDPTRSDSPPGPILIVANGMFFRVSATFDPNTPVVRRAVAACLRDGST